MLVASRDMLLLGPYAVLLIGGHTNKAWDRISREHLDISVVRDIPPSENEHGYTAGMYLLLSQPPSCPAQSQLRILLEKVPVLLHSVWLAIHN